MASPLPPPAPPSRPPTPRKSRKSPEKDASDSWPFIVLGGFVVLVALAGFVFQSQSTPTVLRTAKAESGTDCHLPESMQRNCYTQTASVSEPGQKLEDWQKTVANFRWHMLVGGGLLLITGLTQLADASARIRATGTTAKPARGAPPPAA